MAGTDAGVEQWASEGGVRRGITALRFISIAWSTAVLAVDSASGVADRPAPAVVVLVAAWLWTAVAASRPPPLDATTVGDTLIALAFVTTDSLAWSGPHPQSFGAAWPLCAILGAATRSRSLAVAVAGGISVVQTAVAAVAGTATGRWLALLGAAALQLAAGWVAGTVIARVRGTEGALAEERTRARIAAGVHDSVLQTLAAVQRRSDDPELVSLCADSDRDIRALLSGAGSASPVPATIATAVRERVDAAARRFSASVPVTVMGDDTTAPPELTEAVAGAVGEAAANALEHAGGGRINVFVDLTEAGRVSATVDDDGPGVDASSAGDGISGSILARIEAVGGVASIGSRRGGGTTVSITAPLGREAGR